MNWKTIVAGVASGFLSALIVDIHAWSKAAPEDAFDWGLALKRWIAGAVSGIGLGFGIGELP